MKKIIIFLHDCYSHNLQIRFVIEYLLKNNFKVYIVGSKGYKYIYECYDLEYIVYPEKIDEEINKIDEYNYKEEVGDLFLNFSKESIIKYVTKMLIHDIEINDIYAKILEKKVIEISPDYIMRDTCSLYGRFIADRLSIKSIGYICNICITREIVIRNIIETLEMCWGLDLSIFNSDDCLDIFNQIEKKVKEECEARRIRSIPVLYTLDSDEDMNLIFGSKELQPKIDRKNYKILKYKIDETEMKNINECQKENLVYIATGSEIDGEIMFYNMLIEVIRDIPMKFIISSRMLYEKISESDYILPDNIIVEKYVNQKEILNKSKLFISHGGYNSVCEAILYEVPLIIFPLMSDQFLNATIVDKIGIGIDRRRIISTNNNLKKLIIGMVDNNVAKENIRLIKNSFNDSMDISLALGEFLYE